MTVNRPPVAALRRTSGNSTRGTWREDNNGSHHLIMNDDGLLIALDVTRINAPFIVAAHNEIENLLDYIERLESLCGRAADAITEQGYIGDLSKGEKALLAELRAVADSKNAEGEKPSFVVGDIVQVLEDIRVTKNSRIQWVFSGMNGKVESVEGEDFFAVRFDENLSVVVRGEMLERLKV